MNNENPIFRSLAIIEQQIQEKLTVKALADSIPLSKYHYQRMFREAVGESVMQYVTRRRLALAAAELAEEETTVLEIALKYGYDSHEGFTRSFRAHMGITPTEYRKYHQSIYSPVNEKERYCMTYSKPTDEIIRELNSLIVQAKETAAYARKHKEDTAENISNATIEETPEGETNHKSNAAAGYSQFWERIAKRTDIIADGLTETLTHITAIIQRPDEISARFRILNALEDAASQTHITAFQAGLTVSRAYTDHRAVFRPICEKYHSLSQNAQIKAEKIAEFFQELSTLIFQDMRKNAKQEIGNAVEKGRATAKNLSAEPNLPYAYIAEEITAITESLSSMPLEEITLSLLEDCLFRLDIAALAADADVLRAPSHKQLFDGISEFREQLAETFRFFQSLPTNSAQILTEMETDSSLKHTAEAHILLFYLKGEIQKLGSRLNTEQTVALNAICEKLQKAIGFASHKADEAADSKIQELFLEVHSEIMTEAENLGAYGAPIRYIADEFSTLLQS